MAIRTVAFVGGGNASHVGAAVVAKLGKRARILTRRPEAFSSTMRLLYPDGHESESELDSSELEDSGFCQFFFVLFSPMNSNAYWIDCTETISIPIMIVKL